LTSSHHDLRNLAFDEEDLFKYEGLSVTLA